MPIVHSRRQFLTNVAFASAAGLGAISGAGIGGGGRSLAAEPPPETTKLRLFEGPVTCIAPEWVARELLYSEGFTDVQFVAWGSQTRLWVQEAMLAGEVDISLSFIPSDIRHIDAGSPVVILAGSHIGCVELVGSDRVDSVRDLKGKTVAVITPGSDEQIFVSMFAAYVGLDPHKDINWVVMPYQDKVQQVADGTIGAGMIGPPDSLELRHKKIGHVLVNTTTDKPWSQYFCCMISSAREFVRQHPVATKRALRALLKAADLCALEPERTARLVVEMGEAARYGWQYDSVLQSLKEIPYGQWREYDPEDTVRFYALWMREVGAIKNSPQEIIARGTDLRFLNELKRELKT